MVPGFLLTDGSNMKDGNNTFSPMLQSSFVSFFSFGSSTRFLVMASPEGASQSHSMDTPHSVGILRTSDKPDAGPLPENTQQSQETNFHHLGGIRTCNPSKRAVADPRLRPRVQRDRHLVS